MILYLLWEAEGEIVGYYHVLVFSQKFTVILLGKGKLIIDHNVRAAAPSAIAPAVRVVALKSITTAPLGTVTKLDYSSPSSASARLGYTE